MGFLSANPGKWRTHKKFFREDILENFKKKGGGRDRVHSLPSSLCNRIKKPNNKF